jgi:hypothetical protein
MLFAAGCNPEPGDPHAGQVVIPHRAVGRSFGTETYSLYEYADLNRHTITGKSIQLKIPATFLDWAWYVGGGPQYSLNVGYRRDGDRTIPLTNAQRNGGPSPDKILVALIVTGFVPPFDEAMILHGMAWNAMLGLQVGHALERDPRTYDGYDVYRPAMPKTPGFYPLHDLAARDRDWPFATAVVLARPTAPRKFSPVIACSESVERDGFPYCSLNADYRGWPMEMYFSGRHASHAEALIAQAQKLLDGFVVRETPRSPGQTEHRRQSVARYHPIRP